MSRAEPLRHVTSHAKSREPACPARAAVLMPYVAKPTIHPQRHLTKVKIHRPVLEDDREGDRAFPSLRSGSTARVQLDEYIWRSRSPRSPIPFQNIPGLSLGNITKNIPTKILDRGVCPTYLDKPSGLKSHRIEQCERSATKMYTTTYASI